MSEEAPALFADLSISRTEGRKELKVVDTGDQPLRLRVGYIYTLQGANGAGKSSLIRALMGVPEGDDPVRMRVGGMEVAVKDVADALSHGLVAVFQDDELIPTMTVREQLLLRHAGKGFRTLFRNWSRRLLRRLPDNRGNDIAEKLGLERSVEEQVLERAKRMLEQFDAFDPNAHYVDVLEKYPRQLSGGEFAVARIVLSQVYERVRVMFLDEIFSGVYRDVWPRIVDAFRKWAIENRVSVLVVSHSDAELVRWRPNGRFEMKDRTLRRLPPVQYEAVYAGLPARHSTCAVFDARKHEKWCDEMDLHGPWIVLVDQVLAQTPSFKRIRNQQLRGEVVFELSLAGGETLKSLDSAAAMLSNLAENGEASRSLRGGAVLIVGGGTLLNFGGFIANVLYRGLTTVLVPTTVMAIADVAIGSKTSLNLLTLEGMPFKHALGTYHNPAAIVLDNRFLQELPSEQRRLGLSECLKHGLLQDPGLFKQALALMVDQEPSWERCYDVACQTMELKAEVLSLDPWEASYGRLLLFGHLHAHSLERLSGLTVPHGRAVIFGLLVDLHLSGCDAYAELRDASVRSRVLIRN